LTEKDVVATLATDSMDLYRSRLRELEEAEGPFGEVEAAGVFHRYLMGQGIDNVLEMTYYDRQRVHNLKYYTWVEQQGKTYEEIRAQWYDDDYWTSISATVDEIDHLIEEFNQRTGLLA
jgi:hypothetical protein